MHLCPMQRVGLSGLLSSTRTAVTLVVPVGDALNATINACPLRNETLLSDLLVNAPELSNPLVGYQGSLLVKTYQAAVAVHVH